MSSNTQWVPCTTERWSTLNSPGQVQSCYPPSYMAFLNFSLGNFESWIQAFSPFRYDSPQDTSSLTRPPESAPAALSYHGSKLAWVRENFDTSLVESLVPPTKYKIQMPTSPTQNAGDEDEVDEASTYDDSASHPSSMSYCTLPSDDLDLWVWSQSSRWFGMLR